MLSPVRAFHAYLIKNFMEQKRSLSSLIGGIILGIFVAAIGMIFVVVMFNSWRLGEAIRQWPTAEATITRCELSEERVTPNSPLSYKANIEYAYAFEGKGYNSDRVRRIYKSSSHSDRMQKIVDRYPVGTETTAWVNPDKPSFAILEHESRAVIYTIWFPGLFVVAGIGIAVTAVVKYWQAS